MPDGIEKAGNGIFVADFFRDDISPAERRKVALTPHLLGCRLCDEKITGVFEKRPFEEVPLEGLRKKRMIRIVSRRTVTFFDKVILLMYDREVREDFQGFQSCPVHCFVLGSRDCEEFRKDDAKCGCDVPVLGYDAVVFYGQKRKFPLQCGRFEFSSHIVKLTIE